MKKIICMSLLVFLSGCAHQDEWTRQDTWMQVALTAVIAADGYGTTKIQDHPNIIENGQIAKYALGRNPGDSDVWMYMTTVAISHYLIARALPKGWRSIWQGYYIARHGLAVNKGHQIGLFSQPCTTPVAKEFSCTP